MLCLAEFLHVGIRRNLGFALKAANIFSSISVFRKKSIAARRRATAFCVNNDHVATMSAAVATKAVSYLGIRDNRLSVHRRSSTVLWDRRIVSARPATKLKAVHRRKSSLIVVPPDGSACRESAGLRSTSGSACSVRVHGPASPSVVSRATVWWVLQPRHFTSR